MAMRTVSLQTYVILISIYVILINALGFILPQISDLIDNHSKVLMFFQAIASIIFALIVLVDKSRVYVRYYWLIVISILVNPTIGTILFVIVKSHSHPNHSN